MMTDEQLMDFFIQIVATLVGAFVGAGLAFLFNWLHYKRQKREENWVKLIFLKSCLDYLLENARNLREKVAERRKEVTYHDNLEEEALDPANVKLMAQHLPDADLEWIIAQDKLEFLARPDLSVIHLAGKTKIAFLNLNSIIKDVNADVDKYSKGEKSFYKNHAEETIQKNKYFFDKLDDALERIKELIEAVIKFGCDEYKENLRTSVTNSTDEKYKDMQSKPSPTCKSWKGYEWFPKKKKWWQVKIAGRTTP
jgi:hypothetical protein